MKKNPIIQNFQTPDFVFVNMQNGEDYVRLPLTHLDEKEVKELCEAYVREVCTKAGYDVEVDMNVTGPGHPANFD